MALTTGIRGLDDLIRGLRRGDNVVLESEEGSTSDAFVQAFLRAAARKRRLAYLSFHTPPGHTLERLHSEWDPERFVLVDCFTDGLGGGEEAFARFYRSRKARSFQVIRVAEPADAARVRSRLAELEAELGAGALYLFDSLTGMQSLWGAQASLEAFLITCPRLYELKTVAYWLLERQAHDASFLAQLHHTTQLALSLRSEDKVQVLKILKAEARSPEVVGQELRLTFQEGGKLRVLRDVSEERARVGRALRSRRSARGLSLGELARLVGISPSALSQAERGVSGLSAPTMSRLTEVLGLALASDQQEEEALVPLTREGARPRFALGSGLMAEQLAEAASGARMFLLSFSPREAGHSAPFATKHEELAWVMEGNLVLSLGETEVLLGAGDAVALTDEPVRGWRNPGAEEAKVVWLIL